MHDTENQEKQCDLNPWRFSVAPMMDWTDRNCRLFHRRLSKHARLYTEMVTTGAVLHGDHARLLGFSAEEHPVAVQLGGSDPQALAAAARICADFGYDEINLNVGCPSDRVQEGRFGACLMREPALVGDCVAAMVAAVPLPVTVKCRLGVDDQDIEHALDAVADAAVSAGAAALIVHARKAWLEGLSPRENRDIPPLDYARVRRLKARLPEVPIAINGGITTLAAAQALLAPSGDGPALDGVMLGRAAYQDPAVLLGVDREIFGAEMPDADPVAVLRGLEPEIARLVEAGHSPHAMTRHLLGLFKGRRGGRAFRRILSTEAVRPGAGVEVLRKAIAALGEELKGEAA